MVKVELDQSVDCGEVTLSSRSDLVCAPFDGVMCANGV